MSKVLWKIKPTSEDFILPERGTDDSSCFDVFAAERVTAYSHEDVQLVSLGFSMSIPKGYELKIYPRSGMSRLYPNYIANNVGVIDADYRGDVKVMVVSHSDYHLLVDKGTKIAQVRLEKCIPTCIEIVSELDDTDRGEGGFGSTGE